MENLRSLKTQGATFSNGVRENGLEEVRFRRLHELSIKTCSSWRVTGDDLVLFTLTSTFPNPGLDLTLRGVFYGDFRQSQSAPRINCNAPFHGLHTLHGSFSRTREWMELIVPHCTDLKDLILSIDFLTAPDILYLIPGTIQSLDIRLNDTIWFGEYRAESEIRERSLLKMLSSGRLSDLNSSRS